MYYPHMERQDQYVRILVRIKELDNKMSEALGELKTIHEKIESLMKMSKT